MSIAQHVRAHDGNVQSYPRRLMTTVARESVCRVFPSFFTQLLVPSLRYQRFPLGIFFGILAFSSGRPFGQYDDSGMLPMHNQSGRMFALDGNSVFFKTSCN